MPIGRVVKNYNGYYYVDTGTGELTECRRRGKIKEKIFVGDKLEFTATDAGKGIIEKILPRFNLLKRPTIANIDAMVIVMAAASPDPNKTLVDKILMTCEHGGLTPVLCFNKCDLSKDTGHEYAAYYRQCGYAVYLVSAATGTGLDELKQGLSGKVTAFAGPSGVGKSSLLTAIAGKELHIGEVSRKIGRGRHTTRHSEIIRVDNNTYVIDTPGFSALDFAHMEAKAIAALMPDIRKFAPHCRFASCLHRAEPDCAVKQAVADGLIAPGRYETYCKILDELSERK